MKRALLRYDETPQMTGKEYKEKKLSEVTKKPYKTQKQRRKKH